MRQSLERQLAEQLESVIRRGRSFQRRWMLAVAWLVVAAGLWLAWRTPFLRAHGPVLAVYGALTAAVAAVLALAGARRGWSKQETARRIEARFPDLNAALLTAIEQSPDVVSGRLNVLQHQVVIQALTHSVAHSWRLVVPPRRMACATVAAALSSGALAAVLWTAWNSGEPPRTLAALLAGGAPTEAEHLPVSVDPGDVEVERGTSLLVLARFEEPVPQRVRLVTTVDGEPPVDLACEKSLDDPVFGARISPVMRDLAYRVAFDGHVTRDYRVTVYDLPALERSDLLIEPPSYTGRPAQRLENAFTTAVIEGSRVTITCRVNKLLAEARLLGPGDARQSLQPATDDPRLWSASLTPKESLRLRLELVDERGRRNRDPEEFRIEVLPNLPPKIEVAFPGRDVRVSPLEEFSLEGRVTDDLGVQEYGVVLEIAGREPITVSWTPPQPGPQPQPFQWMQPLEELHLAPDDLLAYHVYALDVGPDGQPRRTTSDLFFAEVRPFEETFRQMDAPAGGGQQSAGGGQQQGNQFHQLIEVQKQIVSATFNLTRQPAAWSGPLAEHVNVLRSSQHQLRDKLLGLIPDLSSVTAQRLAGTASERMEATVERFDDALAQASPVPLASALTSAQAAYQALLKLRARDHRVMQGQQGGGGSSGGAASPSEQQLRELELTNRQNRYQSRQTAASEPATAPQEDLGILDRLRELARRQADLAEKLKELDAARRNAVAEAERQEIERQLKRLRDEQQQLLQDADELRTRLAQSTRQEQLANTRQQLENTRERLLDATEKLREGQLSQALSSATRAERDLQQMHQEFRQQTSARFADALRSLREEARQLTQREQELREQLRTADEPTRPSLRSSRDRSRLEQEFREQHNAVKSVLEQSKQIVQDAETAEPLLSQQLYETLRGIRETQLEQALEAVPQLIKHGFLPEAERAEQQVQQGLERLQTGIEKAAEAVLGNEVESLKRAKAELAELSQQLQREFERQQRQNAASSGDASPSAPGDAGQPGAAPAPTEAAPTGDEGRAPSEEAQSERGQPPTNGQPSGRGQTPASGEPSGQRRPSGGEGRSTESPPMGGEGEPAGQGRQAGDGSPGQPSSSASGGEPFSPQGTSGQSSGGGQSPGGQGAERPSSGNRAGGLRAGGLRQAGTGGSSGGNEWGGFNHTGGGGNAAPLTGEGYREWSQRLRDVETMVSDPQLQAEVARLREQARSLRAEFKRHSFAPNWELVKGTLYEPMVELQRKLAEEVARRESPDSLVPIDRDPIPTRYRELVRSYYERLAKEGESATQSRGNRESR
jgi:hypothetical protein